MIKPQRFVIWKTLSGFALSVAAACTAPAVTSVPAGIDHEPLDTLLQKYVDERGFVDYTNWHRYSEDYKGENSVKVILARCGPEEHRDFLQAGEYRIRFNDYHWGLNAQSDLGEDYRHSWLRGLFR